MAYAELLKGVLAGVSWGISRFLKKKADDEGDGLVEFKPKRLAQPIIIGFIIGLVSWYYGLAVDPAYDLLISYGAVAVIDSLGKALWRRIFGVDWTKL